MGRFCACSKRAHYGEVGSNKAQWCANCANEQAVETERIDKGKMCETCAGT